MVFFFMQVGFFGVQFGLLACMYVDIFNEIIVNKYFGKDKFEENRRFWFNFVVYSVILFFLFFLGVFFWMDNWFYIFGFIFGIFIFLVVMKEIDVKVKGIIRVYVVVIFGILLLVLFIFFIIMFYVVFFNESIWLQYINCIFFIEIFCKNMDVIIIRGFIYLKYVK